MLVCTVSMLRGAADSRGVLIYWPLRSEARRPPVASHAPNAVPALLPLSWLPLQARENASNALFMELLFWKAAPVAEDVRNEYNWIVSCLFQAGLRLL